MAEDAEDDWLFDSIRKYRHLLMFNLQNTAQSLAWTNDKSICVSTSGGDKHEILELSLPEKVLTNTEAEGLCSDRDFGVICGGLTGRCLSNLKLIPNSRSVAAADSMSNGLSVWRLGNSDSDLITQTCRVENNGKDDGHPGTLDVSANHIVFGSELCDVCLVDVETNKVVRDSCDLGETDVLSKLLFIDNNTVIACCRGLPQFWLWDVRESAKTGELHKPRGTTNSSSDRIWTYACNKDSSDVKSAKVFALEDNGTLQVFDIRNLDSFLSEIQLLDFHKPASTSEDRLHFSVQVSPTWSHLLSVSGLDECVHIYDLNCATSGVQLAAEFTHSGHKACSDQSEGITVTSHTWHPWQPNLILSSATDGSLHGWQREFNCS